MKEFVVFVVLCLVYCLNTISTADDEFTGDVWRLTADTFPDERFAPPIGNGHIATNVLSDTIYMNGFYSGYREDSHRARLRSTVAVNATFQDGQESRLYSLDMAKGIFTQEIHHMKGNLNITYFAHRKYSSLMIVHASGVQIKPTQIYFQYLYGDLSPDLANFTEQQIDNNTKYWSGFNRMPETADLSPIKFHQVWTQNAWYSESNANRLYTVTWTWITSISTNREEAFSLYNKAVNMGYDELVRSHIEEWYKIWRNGNVEISGNKEFSRNINAALYNILSSLPMEQNRINQFIGLSPGGLSRGGKINPNKTGGPSNDYAGHAFWDMDTWIMPPIMMFHPHLAKLMIDSRIKVLERAKSNAKLTGYSGARFPWEQAVTGEETCPWDLAAKYQIHVTADISYALRQYIYVSSYDDAVNILKQNGSALALEIAKFWQSRVSTSDEDAYNIYAVMGPDEYHYNINNSVFTNYNARYSLLLPSMLNEKYQIYQQQYHSELLKFKETAEKIKILYNEKEKFHPQYEGFGLNDTIKQSDVVLLGFPLLMPMSKEVRKNDLLIYEKVTDRFGPDTGTWSMHTVGWLELNDEEKAKGMFRMLQRNINGPFKVFSEKPASSEDGPRCVNFITGAGGLLQAVLFGYAGIRIRQSQLELDPHLLPDSDSWNIKALKYKGIEFDVHINDTHCGIKLREGGHDYEPTLTIATQNKNINLAFGQFYQFNRGKFILQVKEHGKNSESSNNASSFKTPLCTMIIASLLLIAYILF